MHKVAFILMFAVVLFAGNPLYCFVVRLPQTTMLYSLRYSIVA